MSGPKYDVVKVSMVPGQIGEADAAVDHQALDLMERRDVTGVGGVAPVALPRHHRVDRRPLALHEADLHR